MDSITKFKSLLSVLTKLLTRKITHETGYFTLGDNGKMKFQSTKEWMKFQDNYGEVSQN